MYYPHRTLVTDTRDHVTLDTSVVVTPAPVADPTAEYTRRVGDRWSSDQFSRILDQRQQDDSDGTSYQLPSGLVPYRW